MAPDAAAAVAIVVATGKQRPPMHLSQFVPTEENTRVRCECCERGLRIRLRREAAAADAVCRKRRVPARKRNVGGDSAALRGCSKPRASAPARDPLSRDAGLEESETRVRRSPRLVNLPRQQDQDRSQTSVRHSSSSPYLAAAQPSEPVARTAFRTSNWTIADSHRVAERNGIWICVSCGRYATTAVTQLAEPCSRVMTRSGRDNLSLWNRGLPPRRCGVSGATAWSQGLVGSGPGGRGFATPRCPAAEAVAGSSGENGKNGSCHNGLNRSNNRSSSSSSSSNSCRDGGDSNSGSKVVGGAGTGTLGTRDNGGSAGFCDVVKPACVPVAGRHDASGGSVVKSNRCGSGDGGGHKAADDNKRQCYRNVNIRSLGGFRGLGRHIHPEEGRASVSRTIHDSGRSRPFGAVFAQVAAKNPPYFAKQTSSSVCSSEEENQTEDDERSDEEYQDDEEDGDEDDKDCDYDQDEDDDEDIDENVNQYCGIGRFLRRGRRRSTRTQASNIAGGDAALEDDYPLAYPFSSPRSMMGAGGRCNDSRASNRASPQIGDDCYHAQTPPGPPTEADPLVVALRGGDLVVVNGGDSGQADKAAISLRGQSE
eukprot:TRINITY_DN5310_c0_g3_i2.p1 TRINITY_DN5310_c0_g3~~TRINITY_DN5310_c0_g3_i2.p1  ORF type:complete len:613 (-),score=101.17 TRINITY_DN5310_c0_g3_i2:23-1810(-)